MKSGQYLKRLSPSGSMHSTSRGRGIGDTKRSRRYNGSGQSSNNLICAVQVISYGCPCYPRNYLVTLPAAAAAAAAVFLCGLCWTRCLLWIFSRSSPLLSLITLSFRDFTTSTVGPAYADPSFSFAIKSLPGREDLRRINLKSRFILSNIFVLEIRSSWPAQVWLMIRDKWNVHIFGISSFLGRKQQNIQILPNPFPAQI